MIELDVLGWALLGAAALIAGLSKTAVPGAGTLCVALFAWVLPARESTAALLVLLIVGDLFAVWTYRHDVDWRTLRRLVPGVLAGLVVGAAFLGFATDDAVRRVIGVILLALLAVTLWRRRPAAETPSPGRASGYVFGTLGGFTTMVANAGGPVMSMYLLSMRLPVRQFLGTVAYFFFAINLSKLPFQVGLGLLDGPVLALSATLVPLVVIGAILGRVLVGRFSQQAFERIVLVLTGVGAVYLLL